MISFLYYFHYVRYQRIFLPLFGISISIEEILITETIEYRWYKSKYLEGGSTSKDSTSRSSTSRFKALFPIYFLKGSRDSKVSTYEYQGGFPQSRKMATFGNDSLESPYEKSPSLVLFTQCRNHHQSEKKRSCLFC